MADLLCRKLENFIELRGADRQALLGLTKNIVRLKPGEDIIQEGDAPRCVNLVLEGWACRYKQLEDGRRQIVAFFLPGDMCDPCVFLLDEMSHSLGSLTPLTLARIPQEEIAGIIAGNTTLSKAFWLDMLVSTEVQREWTVSLGRRTADERLAHLFCEICLRLKSVGLTNGHECEMPVTQADLADALGLSAVHVNRTLQELRATGFVELKSRRLTIFDQERLRALAMFNPSYLHLQRHTGN